MSNLNKVYSITVDMKNVEGKYSSYAKFFDDDRDTSIIKIKLLNDNYPIDLEGCTVEAEFILANNTYHDETCKIINTSEGIVELQLCQECLVVGKNTVRLSILKENEIANTPVITYEVKKGLYSDNPNFNDDPLTPVLSQMLLDVKVTKANQIELQEKYEKSLPKIEGKIKEVESLINRVDTAISSGTQDLEVKEARVDKNGIVYAKLGDRLDEVDSQLEHVENNGLFKNESQFILPEWFGAKKDGTYDDAIAINKAINKSIELRKGVILSGTYFIKSPIFIKKEVYLRGQGVAKIFLQNNSNCEVLKSFDNIDALNRVSIGDFIIDANGENQSDNEVNTILLNATSADYADKHSLFSNITVFNSKGVGLYIDTQVRETKFQNINIRNIIDNAKNGIYISGTDNYFDNIVVVGGLNGFYLKGSNNKFTNSKAFYNKECGFIIDVGSHNQFSTIEAQENGTNGLKLLNWCRGNIFSSSLLDTNGRLNNECSEVFIDSGANYNYFEGSIIKRDLNGFSRYMFECGEIQTTHIYNNIFNITTTNQSNTKHLVPFKNIFPVSNKFILNGCNNVENISNFSIQLDNETNLPKDYMISDYLGMLNKIEVDKINKSIKISVRGASNQYDGLRFGRKINVKPGDCIGVSVDGYVDSSEYSILIVERFYDINNNPLGSEIKSGAITGSDVFNMKTTQLLHTEVLADSSYCTIYVSIFSNVDGAGSCNAYINNIIIERL